MVMQLVGLLLFVFVFTLISFDQRTLCVSVSCVFLRVFIHMQAQVWRGLSHCGDGAAQENRGYGARATEVIT